MSHFHSQANKAVEPHWTDDDSKERDPRPKDADEAVEMRRRGKRLQDMELPAGFRLISERPKQHWLVNQLVYGFWLGWAKVDRFGNREPDKYIFFARYYPQVSDEPQMRWAIDDFRRELQKQEELDREEMKPAVVAGKKYRAEIVPQRNWHDRHLGFAS